METNSSEEIPTETSLQDEIIRLNCVNVKSKVKGIDILSYTSQNIYIACTLKNNSLQTWKIDIADKSNEAMLLSTIHHQAHRSDVRTLVPSSFSDLLFSAAAESLRVWSR